MNALQFFAAALVAALVAVAFPAWPAFAYLDPGTGSILLQGAIAGLATALFLLRSYLYRLTSFLTGRKKTDEPRRPGDP